MDTPTFNNGFETYKSQLKLRLAPLEEPGENANYDMVFSTDDKTCFVKFKGQMDESKNLIWAPDTIYLPYELQPNSMTFSSIDTTEHTPKRYDTTIISMVDPEASSGSRDSNVQSFDKSVLAVKTIDIYNIAKNSDDAKTAAENYWGDLLGTSYFSIVDGSTNQIDKTEDVVYGSEGYNYYEGYNSEP